MAIRLQHHTDPPAAGQRKYFSANNGIFNRCRFYFILWFKYVFVVFGSPEGVEAALAGRPIVLCNGDRVDVQRRSAKSQR